MFFFFAFLFFIRSQTEILFARFTYSNSSLDFLMQTEREQSAIMEIPGGTF